MENMPIHNTVSSPPGPSAAMKQGGRKIDRQRLKKACADFEALFLAQMLKQMRKSVPQMGFLGPGAGKEIYQTLMDQELSRKMVQRGGMGLGERLYRQIIRSEDKTPALSPQGKPFQARGRSHLKIEGDHERAGRPSAASGTDD